jgi:hypothetical protein
MNQVKLRDTTCHTKCVYLPQTAYCDPPPLLWDEHHSQTNYQTLECATWPHRNVGWAMRRCNTEFHISRSFFWRRRNKDIRNVNSWCYIGVNNPTVVRLAVSLYI